ncbi:MAG: membrane protein, putative [uncultured Sphingosinicella sp.]|uniref:Membrane protein, putative n=1 Tax=uncultured Sphingosinicella sp. TaxID=478748 RepID=A0A6J4U7L3_9SPHN|nr:DUF418 domain-containing protein [uncultured Sphingosinicella sp.]CAA9543021.1 MAG: membrane protein, putative [uncultured Sphingosinicella sp.]
MTDTSAPPPRIASMDAVRGMAVCGILLMNIVVMGHPGSAYNNPTFYGAEGRADMAAWLINFILAEGKMRALFTMLFGASMVLIADRAEARETGSAIEAHLRRMFWLFMFGMIHAWLIWFGDILVQYAVGGAFAFVLWRFRPRALWILFAGMIAIELLQFGATYLQQAGATPLSARDVAAQAAQEIASYRGGFADVFAARARTTVQFQTDTLVAYMPETIGFMALGILFYRNGFLSAAWSRRAYWRTIAIGYLIAAPLTLALAWLLLARDFAPGLGSLTEGLSLILRPFIALAHAAAVILLVRSGDLRWFTSRLEAAGRMALSNYLGTSLLTTTFFYGYGFGMFGQLSRAELYWVVLAVWVLILAWSKPWLERYRYGPLEWLWRSLASGERQPMRREVPV